MIRGNKVVDEKGERDATLEDVVEEVVRRVIEIINETELEIDIRSGRGRLRCLRS